MAPPVIQANSCGQGPSVVKIQQSFEWLLSELMEASLSQLREMLHSWSFLEPALGLIENGSKTCDARLLIDLSLGSFELPLVRIAMYWHSQTAASWFFECLVFIVILHLVMPMLITDVLWFLSRGVLRTNFPTFNSSMRVTSIDVLYPLHLKVSWFLMFKL